MRSRQIIDTYFDDIRASQYEFCLMERPEIPAPNLRVENIVVPGRHGSLTIKDAYDDIEFTCRFNILEKKKNVKYQIIKIKEFLAGKKTISFEDNFERYYKIKELKVSNIDNHYYGYGEFTVDLRCDPFQYERTLPRVVESGVELYNFSSEYSLPLIEITGTGNNQIKINDYILDIKNLADILIIDSDLMLAYYDNGSERVNQNNKLRGEFPTLVAGENLITYTSGITSMTLNPRWRYL